ncbi:unnamed protein product [Orchesella dallaii]|uniref:CHK kinase-like domain-containing protein n=1 Tax=Orchesella dallaii TaxID=48710 RepID=A0ABP1RZH5_9HEXA
MTPDRQFEKSEIEKLVGEPITDFSSSSGSNKGDNVAGTLLALKVTTAAGKELNLVYKSFPSDNPEQRQYVVQFGIFRTETCMYEKVFPRLKELVALRKAAKNIELPTVKYISGFNDDQNDYVCLEDMRPEGYIMQDKFQSLTSAEVTLIMKEMAKFHALTYFMLRYDGERIFEEDDRVSKLKYNAFTIENPMMIEMGTRMFYGYMENTVTLLEDRDKSLAEHVKNFVGKHSRHSFHALTRFNSKRTDKESFPCIIHGDLWTNNVLFKYESSGGRDAPTQLKFIDFQLSRRGNIFEDLGYFFWTSTTPQFRKLHLDQMLSIYTKSFEDTMDQLDYPKPEGFSRGYVIDKFYQGMLGSYTFMPFALSLQMGDLEAVLEDKDEKVTNGASTNGEKQKEEAQSGPPAIDFDKMMEANNAMMLLRMKKSPRALQRLEDLTREAVERKLLL